MYSGYVNSDVQKRERQQLFTWSPNHRIYKQPLYLERLSHQRQQPQQKHIQSYKERKRNPFTSKTVDKYHTMTTEEPLRKKIKLQGESHEGQPETSPKNTLYVNNLNDQIRPNTLRENLYLLFSTYGEVIQVSMTSKERGQAFVLLRTMNEANLAMISLQDEPFFGKPLRIRFSRTDSQLVWNRRLSLLFRVSLFPISDFLKQSEFS